ncbi:MAG: YitT family protein [Spirochaetales bacterium]|nr:YitT family protein [Candidatus Physcosoma equi]
MKRFPALAQNRFIATILIIAAGIIGALNYELFVFPNNFAPAGLNGICTLIQYLFHFSFGYMSLLINIPLLIFAYLVLEKDYAINNMVYIVSFSVASLLFRKLDFSSIAFIAQDGGEKMLAAIAAGIFNGLIYTTTIRLRGSTGGMDIVARFVHTRRPEFEFVWIIFVINSTVAVLSFFVYGMNYAPVILCITYSFVTSRVNDSLLKGAKSAAKFEVITREPDVIAKELMTTLRHGVTMVKGKGMYSGQEVSMLICVVNRTQIADFEKILHQHPDVFVIVSSANTTIGNFKKIK